MRDRFSSVDQIIGNSKEQKDIVTSYAAHRFEFQEQYNGECEKTPEELSMIQLADEATNALRVQYGLPPFSIPSKNIHIIKSETWRRSHSNLAGKSVPGSQSIRMEKTDNLSQFAHVVVHEMIHFKSFDVWRILQEDVQPALVVIESHSKDDPPKKLRMAVTGYRSGLHVGNSLKDKSFFNALNEAVVEELTKRIVFTWRQNAFLSAEWKQTSELINPKKVDPDEVIYLKKIDGKRIGNVFAYKRERKALHLLMSKVVERNPGKFTDIDDVFDSFVKMFFTGRAGTFMQIFDQTFGQGTLRKIAECDDDIHALEELVENL